MALPFMLRALHKYPFALTRFPTKFKTAGNPFPRTQSFNYCASLSLSEHVQRTSRKLATPSDRVFDDAAPTEAAVEALMYTLVDPMLSLSVPRSTGPSRKDDNSVAKQMHAVVLLYNYYYRKKKPELEFLDLGSFCKLAASGRYKLDSFMKATTSPEQNLDKYPLSATEKAVKEACDIAAALDSSRGFPNLESFQISKVAVLVIDSEHEHCLLRFGSDTQCVWSLIEKDLDNESIKDDHKLLEIAFDAVKGITGIDRDDLEVLETHYTYSLRKHKSAVKFYMMKYCIRKKFEPNQRTPLKFLVESLRGPLVRNYYGGWSTTDFVDYHEMLPYERFISNWLSRCSSNTPNTFTQRLEVAESVKEKIIINSENEYPKGSSSDTSKRLQSTSGLNNTSSDSKKLNSKQEVHNEMSVQQGINVQSDTADHLKTDATIALVQFEAIGDTKPKNKQDSEDLRSALALVSRKRLELTSKIEIMEDELALHEDCIERIRDGGDVDLARQCLNSFVSGNDDLLLKTEVERQSGFPNIFLPGRCSCQDLEYTCLKNNWRLPRYIVEPYDGKFVSLVSLGSKDFELCVKGGSENSPRESRESGAVFMIEKLQERFSG